MMSSNPHKLHRKRPADSGDIDPNEGDRTSDKPEDFKIKTLDEILQEKRRRIEDDDEPGEERNGSSEGNSRGVSPATSARRESRTSSKQGSPVQGSGSEIIYQLSPEQMSLSPTSSTSGTPKKVKPQLSHDVGPVGIRVKKGRKTTEEEEGEIVSDPSDSESRRGEKRARRYSTISNPDADSEKPKYEESKERGATITKKSEESSKEEDTNEEESEDDTETATATKRARKGEKEMANVKQEDSESESASGSEESSSEDDDDDDDDGDKEEDAQKESKIKQKEIEVKTSGSKEPPAKNSDDADDAGEEEESSSDEEDSSDEDSEEEESESDSSEESEKEEVKEEVSQKTEQVTESSTVEEFESEDLHKELQQLKHHRSTDERHKHKVKAERHHHQDRGHRRSEESVLDTRSDKEHKTFDKEKTHSKHRNILERRHSESKTKSRSYEKDRSGDVHIVESKQRESRDKQKSYAKESSKTKLERTGTRERYPEMLTDREKKSSRKDLEKRHKSSTAESTKVDSKEKDRRGSRRKSSEKAANDSRGGGEEMLSSKSKKDEGKSLILTARERRQFTNEVVDIESEGSSDEDHKEGTRHSDSEIKHSDDEHEGVEKETNSKLPAYYPAVRGCRNVEEFQWLNRIEEGTYGVVYRAKDKRTGDIVALKKLKMEREKEGFPITSLREINTLLKAQHPNIVTVREIVVGSNMDKIYIVMDYVEHDLKVLMEHMTQGFRIGEIKTLMIQLLRAVAHLHDNWILHRDLKASNLLLSNKGILKVGDFGLAREYGSPLKNYTPIVVTLWYRAPELLLGTKEYSTPIDLWSVGCIFAELLTMKPLFPGKSEIDQINRIFKDLGTPSDKIWPGPPSYSELPAVKKMTFTDYPFNNLRNKFGAHLTDKGFNLLNRFLTYDPKRRITAEDALQHEYLVSESPQPVDPSMFPTWPAKSEMAKRPKKRDVEHSPQAPEGGAMFAKLADEADSGNGGQGFHMPTSKKGSAAVVGFTLKF